jgi:hypothetical protein
MIDDVGIVGLHPTLTYDALSGLGYFQTIKLNK